MAPLHIETPLVLSNTLSKLINNVPVYLKLETCQPTGSFKMRCVGYRAQQAVLEGADHLVTASCGNAGLALSRSASLLKTRGTVYVPITTSDVTVERLEAYGATVVRQGINFNTANEFALEEGRKPGTTYVSSFDHPDAWTGNASLVTELRQQLPHGAKPGVIVLAVGGGGLLSGVLQGLDNEGWSDVPIIAMETEGAHSFNISFNAKKLVALDEITSIALTLGALSVTPHLIEVMSQYNITSEVILDAQAVESCLRFSSDERLLVEPSCGATLSAIYCGIVDKMVSNGKLTIDKDNPVVLVVCGGSDVSIKQLHDWAKRFDVPFPAGQ